jgi:hypothetical protein
MNYTNGQPYYPVNQQQNDLNFQNFSYSQSYAPQEFDASIPTRHDLPYGVTWESVKRAFSTGGFDNEPPLLEGNILP